MRLRDANDLDALLARTHADLTRGNDGGLIVEGFVRFDRELSVLAARGLDGSIACWPLVENDTIDALSDFIGYQQEFLRLFGFGLTGVDYDAEVDPVVAIAQLRS